MACGAALWYNVSIKLLCSRGGLTPLERAPNLRLNRRLDTMDSLFPNAPQDKTCTRCGHSKSSKLFPRRNEWCRLCLQRAHDATPPGKKFCVGCKAYLFLPAFRSETISLGRVRLESFCKRCASKRSVELSRQKYDATASRDQNLQKNHGLTLTEFRKLRPLSVDHCHVTGAIRGLLCDHCNRALGGLASDPYRTISLLRYIVERCLW